MTLLRGGSPACSLAAPVASNRFALDCLNDVDSGHADSEEDATQLERRGRLGNMIRVVCVGEHEESPCQADSAQDH